MSKKLFLGTLAMILALPVIVAPVQAQEVVTKVSQDFKDVSKSHSNYTEIMEMRNAGIISGYPDNTFKPSASISRLHVATLFVRSMDLKPMRAGKEFKDVLKSSPYYNDVQTVYRAGIFDGKQDGTFGVTDNLTRAHMAKVLANAFDLERHSGFIFDDVSESHWAKDDIATLYMSGVTTGDNGKYKPSAPVSRAHYATFLYRALHPDKAPTPDKPLSPKPPVTKPEKPEITPPGTKPTPPVTPAPPVVKPTPPPVVKPEPTPPIVQPTPPVTPPTAGNPFPGTVRPPSGWSESTAKQHDSKVKDTVYKYSPKVGTGESFGTSSFALNRFDNVAEMKSIIEGNLKDIKSNQTYSQWVDAVNQVLKSGGIYIAPDYSYAVYIVYVSGGRAVIKFAR